MAVDFLVKHHRQLDLDSLRRLLQLVQRHSWWDTVGGLAGVVGGTLLQARVCQCNVQRQMEMWLSHSNLWVCRVAMLHQQDWKAHTDEARLLRYALTLAPEADLFIRKATGWALCDHARTRLEAVRTF